VKPPYPCPRCGHREWAANGESAVRFPGNPERGERRWLHWKCERCLKLRAVEISIQTAK